MWATAPAASWSCSLHARFQDGCHQALLLPHLTQMPDGAPRPCSCTTLLYTVQLYYYLLSPHRELVLESEARPRATRSGAGPFSRLRFACSCFDKLTPV